MRFRIAHPSDGKHTDLFELLYCLWSGEDGTVSDGGPLRRSKHAPSDQLCAAAGKRGDRVVIGLHWFLEVAFQNRLKESFGGKLVHVLTQILKNTVHCSLL